MRRNVLCLPALALLLLLVPVSAKGQMFYDAVAEFSATNGNPNGVWSYGKSPGATDDFTAHTDHFTSSTFDGWNNGTEFETEPYPEYYPLIMKNVTAGVIDLGSGQVVPNDVLYLHPGCEPPESSVCEEGSWSVLRFTAPTDGTFTFAGGSACRSSRTSTSS
jgi:hypothetical protein